MSHTDRTTPDPRGLGQASRTTAPLTLDAMSRAEVGPVDVFGSAGEAATLLAAASARCPLAHDPVVTPPRRHLQRLSWLTQSGRQASAASQ